MYQFTTPVSRAGIPQRIAPSRSVCGIASHPLKLDSKAITHAYWSTKTIYVDYSYTIGAHQVSRTFSIHNAHIPKQRIVDIPKFYFWDSHRKRSHKLNYLSEAEMNFEPSSLIPITEYEDQYFVAFYLCDAFTVEDSKKRAYFKLTTDTASGGIVLCSKPFTCLDQTLTVSLRLIQNTGNRYLDNKTNVTAIHELESTHAYPVAIDTFNLCFDYWPDSIPIEPKAKEEPIRQDTLSKKCEIISKLKKDYETL